MISTSRWQDLPNGFSGNSSNIDCPFCFLKTGMGLL